MVFKKKIAVLFGLETIFSHRWTFQNTFCNLPYPPMQVNARLCLLTRQPESRMCAKLVMSQLSSFLLE